MCTREHVFGSKRSTVVVAILLVGTTFVVFCPVLKHEFVNYDDEVYVTQNPHIQNGLDWRAVKGAFLTFRAGNWHPLTWISHMLDIKLYGLKPWGHHLTNIILHLMNVLLIFLVFEHATGSLWKSAFVAGVFGIHPLHVESVAWVAERKDVLSTAFGFLTLLAYVHYAQLKAADKANWRFVYGLMVFAYMLGLMSKPMLVTLPFMMLLMDYWPLQRFSSGLGSAIIARDDQRFRKSSACSLVVEKSPLFMLSFCSCAITYIAQSKGGAVASFEHFPMGVRIWNALVAYIQYIVRAFWPKDLGVIYPHPGASLGMWTIAGSFAFLAILTALALRLGKIRKYVITSLFWFLGSLIPVIGLVQIGRQATADRYMYVPLIGLSILVAWATPELVQARWKPRGQWHGDNTVLVFCSLASLAVLGVIASLQTSHWRNSISLFRQAIRVTENNYLAHANLGVALLNRGNVEEAVGHFSRACEIRPDFAPAHSGLGMAMMNTGHEEEALRHLKIALSIDPKLEDAHNNLGVLYMRSGKLAEALDEYARALHINPYSAVAHHNMGVALAAAGKDKESISYLRRACELAPEDVTIRFNLATALMRVGSLDNAMREYQAVLRIAPNHPQAHAGLAAVLCVKGRYQEAAREFRLCRKYGGVPGAALEKTLSRLGLR